MRDKKYLSAVLLGAALLLVMTVVRITMAGPADELLPENSSYGQQWNKWQQCGKGFYEGSFRQQKQQYRKEVSGESFRGNSGDQIFCALGICESPGRGGESGSISQKLSHEAGRQPGASV